VHLEDISIAGVKMFEGVNGISGTVLVIAHQPLLHLYEYKHVVAIGCDPTKSNIF
jgi:hypothetical protein